MIGVLGGLGPAATVDFLGKIVRLTPASRDQEHIPVLAASLPHVPDRSACIWDMVLIHCLTCSTASIYSMTTKWV